jgi:hypothetical protein
MGDPAHFAEKVTPIRRDAGSVMYPRPSWWRRALLRLAGCEPAAVWDCPDEPQVFYEDQWIPPDAQELWGRKLRKERP